MNIATRPDQSWGPIWGAADVTSAKGAGDENFPVGSLLIAKAMRPHVHAYYAFARAVDDMADNTRLSPQAKIARLEGMAGVIRGELEAPPRADAQTAATLRVHLLETGVPFETATDLTVAFCRDAVKTRYDSWDELVDYCRYSANPVGHFLLRLHGEPTRTLAPSDALCTALQILNHLQDASDDLRILDRCYIPRPWLAEEGVTVDDLRLVRAKPGLRRVFDRILDGVDRFNRDARALPGMIRDRRMRLEAAVIVNLAHRLAARLRREDPVAGRVELSKSDKIAALGAALRFLP
ncbi:squalene synthase HpnC [Tanticharoenia sakaeratensis]|uniref:Squalene synthase HpnC n=1 Tax=Tanticharoenia sakaeratensis NBRC 103193 TaxID=1231623 RepID=A0A0D6MJ15_9PROT|nr:squalene synthase HpnC [Tanticharoenia sakaeratensis]GAN53481.1 squalene synthase HpnC [Tanticharoenia sakaeratensis NBRC 103193]GBQ17753.1 phytoene synthase [Tanticharoenia sakaeratensis NBRC 103193]